MDNIQLLKDLIGRWELVPIDSQKKHHIDFFEDLTYDYINPKGSKKYDFVINVGCDNIKRIILSENVYKIQQITPTILVLKEIGNSQILLNYLRASE